MKRFFFLTFLFYFMSCAVFIPGYSDYSSARKYYFKGQFDLAAQHLSKSLTLKPNNKKAIRLFELSYNSAVSEHQRKINRLLLIENKSKWPRLVTEYSSLIKLGDHVKRLKPMLKNTVNYDSNFIRTYN